MKYLTRAAKDVKEGVVKFTEANCVDSDVIRYLSSANTVKDSGAECKGAVGCLLELAISCLKSPDVIHRQLKAQLGYANRTGTLVALIKQRGDWRGTPLFYELVETGSAFVFLELDGLIGRDVQVSKRDVQRASILAVLEGDIDALYSLASYPSVAELDRNFVFTNLRGTAAFSLNSALSVVMKTHSPTVANERRAILDLGQKRHAVNRRLWVARALSALEGMSVPVFDIIASYI